MPTHDKVRLCEAQKYLCCMEGNGLKDTKSIYVLDGKYTLGIEHTNLKSSSMNIGYFVSDRNGT